jgi:hypothetical protein
VGFDHFAVHSLNERAGRGQPNPARANLPAR